MPNYDEEVIVDRKAKDTAKIVSLFALAMVLLSGVHIFFNLSLLEPSEEKAVFVVGMILSIIATAYNGKALGKDAS